MRRPPGSRRAPPPQPHSEIQHWMCAGVSRACHIEHQKACQLPRRLAQQVESWLYGAHISRRGVIKFGRQKIRRRRITAVADQVGRRAIEVGQLIWSLH